MGAAASKHPLAIPPHSKLWGILADLVTGGRVSLLEPASSRELSRVLTVEI